MHINLGKPKLRRSEIRLGKRTIYQTTTVFPRVSLVPLLDSLQAQRDKLVAIFGLTLLIWAVYSLFSQPQFFVYSAQIQGNEAVSMQEIYYAAGIDTKSIFWLNPTTIEANITALPNVKSASVTVRLPAEITISVVEHRPELLWQTGDEVWWVDDEGIVVPPRSEETAGMLRIVDNDQQPLEVGYQIDPTIVKGAQMLQLLVPGLVEIRHGRQHGLTVATPEGWPVYLGDGREIRRKLVSLTAVLAHLKQEKLNPIAIDVRNPLRPFYKEEHTVVVEQPRPTAQPSGQPAPPVNGRPQPQPTVINAAPLPPQPVYRAPVSPPPQVGWQSSSPYNNARPAVAPTPYLVRPVR